MQPTSEGMMTFDWYQMEGGDLAGKYRLKQCLSSSADDAWYLTRFNRANAAVRVMISGTTSTHGQLDTWRELLKLQHPHLVSVLDAGRAELGGTGLIYLVTEYPDDFLAAAVAERALAEGEAREVLSACLSALTYLHGKGLVHSAVDPAHIVSIGDRIKLTSDTIRPVGADLPLTVDRSALEATLVEVLTGKRPCPGGPLTKIPEPFAKIVERAFGADSAEQSSVKDPMEEVERPAAPAVTEPVKIPPPPAAPEIPPAPTAPPAPSPEPAAAGKPVMASVKRGLPLKWVPLVGLAASLPLVLMMGRHPESTTPAPPVVAERAAPEPLPPPAAAPSAAQPPAVKSVPVPPPRPAPPIRNPEAADPSDNWRVVVYEYRNRTAAEKEINLLNAKHPAWHAEIFTPRTSRGVYLISIGGWMTQGQAERLRREARAQGLPRDTFIRNFR